MQIVAVTVNILAIVDTIVLLYIVVVLIQFVMFLGGEMIELTGETLWIVVLAAICICTGIGHVWQVVVIEKRHDAQLRWLMMQRSLDDRKAEMDRKRKELEGS